MLWEIAALRQQLAVYQRNAPKPKLNRRDRRFWIWLCRRWPKRFIRRISTENSAWGEDRIALEMKLKLGIAYASSTVRRYMSDEGPVPSSTWRTFLANHAPDIYALDFTTQVMWDFSVCYVLVVIEHQTRTIVHTNVTRKPSLDWVKQQIRECCPGGEEPRFILHDNDGIFGQFGRGKPFRCALDQWLSEVMGIRGISTPYHAPNANSICERAIGTLKRDALNHFIFRSERHLRRTVSAFVRYSNEARPHQGIDGIPGEYHKPRVPLDVEGTGTLIGEPILGGLHHDYRLAA